MKKLTILTFSLLISFALYAQKASKETIDETCSCVNKIKTSLSEDEKLNNAIMCMTASVVKNMDRLKKEYNIKEKDEREAGRQVGAKIGAQLVTDCPEMGAYLVKLGAKQSQAQGEGEATADADINPDTLKLDNGVCKLFKEGKYKSDKTFLNRKFVQDEDATSFSEIKGGFAYDYTQNNKNVTKWSVKFLSDCEWELTLIETNDPNIKAVFKKGDKLTYKAIGSEGKSLWIGFKILGMEGISLISKI